MGSWCRKSQTQLPHCQLEAEVLDSSLCQQVWERWCCCRRCCVRSGTSTRSSTLVVPSTASQRHPQGSTPRITRISGAPSTEITWDSSVHRQDRKIVDQPPHH